MENRHYFWRPFTQMATHKSLGEIVRAEGSYLILKDGKRLFDGISSWWVIAHGHCHPPIVEAVQAQAACYDQVIPTAWSHSKVEQLSARLVEVTPETLNHAFFSDDGSTAVEAALKMAWQAMKLRGETERTKLVAFRGAYHGDTVGAMSMAERGLFNEPFWSLLFDVHLLEYGNTLELESFMSHDGSEVCALMLEPMVQGAGGMNMCTPDFIKDVRRLCSQYGAWMIADEVMTGFGRTGKMFACDHADISPDIMCLSKCITGGMMTMGVTMACDAIYDCFLGDSVETAFLHGHSYTANPIACAAALANLKVYETESTLAHITKLTKLMEAYEAKLNAHPRVHNLRILGGIMAFEYGDSLGAYDNAAGQIVAAACLNQGLFIRPLGNTIYLMPPFATTHEQLDLVLQVLVKALG